jgi:hypothetical protein
VKERNFVLGVVQLFFQYLQKPRQYRMIFRRRKMLFYQKTSEKIEEKAQKDGIDFSKRIKAEEDAVETALVGAFDMADKGAALLDDAVGEIVDFIKRIQI